MPKFIILEGMDSTGKSTLSKYIADRLDAMYFHSSGHRTLHLVMQAHHQQILDCAEVNLNHGHNFVLDRHWPTQHAYATVLRPHIANLYDIDRLRNQAHALGATYIYCYDVDYVRYCETHKNHDKFNFHHLSAMEYYQIHLEYEYIFKDVPHIRYKIEEEGKDLEKFTQQFL